MGKKKEVTLLSEAELHAKINRLVEIRPLANEYNELCRKIKPDMLARGASEIVTPEGNRALIVSKPSFIWVVEKLAKALKRAVFNTLCPRKADAKKLNQRLLANPEDKALAACRIAGNPKYELEVLAKGEQLAQLGSAETEEDETEAAA